MIELSIAGVNAGASEPKERHGMGAHNGWEARHHGRLITGSKEQSPMPPPRK